MHPVTDLGKLQRGESHSHVVVSVLPVNLQPLVSREDADDFPLPAFQSRVPHTAVHPRAAGPRPGITVLVDQVVRLILHRTKAVDQLPRPVTVKPREVDAFPCQVVRGRSYRQTHEGPAVGPAQFQEGVVKVHADLLGALDPAFGDTSAFDPDPAHQGYLGGGLTGLGAVDVRRSQEAHPQLTGSLNVILPIMHAVGSGQNVALRHQDPGAAGGDPHGCGERVVQQEVVTADVEAPISPVNLSFLTPVPTGNSPSSHWWWLNGRTDGALIIIFVLHIHSGEGTRTIRIERLEGQLLSQVVSPSLLLSLVVAAGVTVSGEVQLRLSTEARAGEGQGYMGHQ